jgi:hypothetical protein
VHIVNPHPAATDSINSETVNAESFDIVLCHLPDRALPIRLAEIKAPIVKGVSAFVKDQPLRFVASHFAMFGSAIVGNDVLPNSVRGQRWRHGSCPRNKGDASTR